MSVRTSHRFAAIAAPVMVAGLVLGACGGSDGDGESASKPTVTLDTEELAYQTLPPATTTTTIPSEVIEAAPQQEYVIQSGDIGITIAEKFDITLEELENANGWSSASVELPFPGESIVIPAGASDGTSTGSSSSGSSDGGQTGEAIDDPGDNCGAGSYVLENGDNPSSVANKFNVSLDELNAANADNSAYTAFIVGETVVIPEC